MASVIDGLRRSSGDPSPEISSTKLELLNRRQTVINAVNTGARDLSLQIPAGEVAGMVPVATTKKDKFFLPQNHTPRTTDDWRQPSIDSAHMAVDEALKNEPRDQA